MLGITYTDLYAMDILQALVIPEPNVLGLAGVALALGDSFHRIRRRPA